MDRINLIARRLTGFRSPVAAIIGSKDAQPVIQCGNKLVIGTCLTRPFVYENYGGSGSSDRWEINLAAPCHLLFVGHRPRLETRSSSSLALATQRQRRGRKPLPSTTRTSTPIDSVALERLTSEHGDYFPWDELIQISICTSTSTTRFAQSPQRVFSRTYLEIPQNPGAAGLHYLISYLSILSTPDLFHEIHHVRWPIELGGSSRCVEVPRDLREATFPEAFSQILNHPT